MSQNLGQSTNGVAISSRPEEEFDFNASAKRACERRVKNKEASMTQERLTFNRQKLISAVCAEYRAHYPSLYKGSERLPTVLYEKVEAAVDNQITEALSKVNATNIISHRAGYHFDYRQSRYTWRLINTGENLLTFKEQHLASTIHIEKLNRTLSMLEAKKTPDYEREKEVKEQLMKADATRSFIEAKIAELQKLEATPKS
jgi:hypothetical protein